MVFILSISDYKRIPSPQIFPFKSAVECQVPSHLSAFGSFTSRFTLYATLAVKSYNFL